MGKSRSCGCLKNEIISKLLFKHGYGNTRRTISEYRIWRSLKERCLNTKSKSYPNYGGRGIKVCERWLNSDGFINFLEDMGFRPTEKHSLDRFPNNDGDYEKSNCRWATDAEQSRNKRTNRWIEFKNKKMIISDWATELNCSHRSLRRMIGVKKSFEDAYNFYFDKIK